MNKRNWIAFLIVLLCAFLLIGSALAMSSTSYALEWYVPLSGGGGGEASSANYAVNFTVGQTTIGNSSSANYGVGLGYWVGLIKDWLVYLFLPLVQR